jgi:hypothetical protein
MKAIAILKVKVYKTTDKKKVKGKSKNYNYGAINIRSPDLADYVGKIVKVRIEKVDTEVG